MKLWFASVNKIKSKQRLKREINDWAHRHINYAGVACREGAVRRAVTYTRVAAKMEAAAALKTKKDEPN